MLILQIFLLIVGLVLLVKGADWLVDGSAGIARKLKISPLVIGLTVVAFGTSAPELAVSVTSAIKHSTDIAVGNVVGSNIANILLILGLSALIRSLAVQKSSLCFDFPVLIGASALLIVFGLWGDSLIWWEGVIFLAIFAGYLAFLILQAKREQKKLKLSSPMYKTEGEMNASSDLSEAELSDRESPASETAAQPQEAPPKGGFFGWVSVRRGRTWFLVLLFLVGLAMVVGGSSLLVNAAKYIASKAGVSERIIALTVVAIGTSLPELVTSVFAAIKGESDIAVGNVLGSNIFNILVVAGASALFYPLAFTHVNLIDAAVALGAAVLLFAIVLIGKMKIGRIGGALMLISFCVYYGYLFIA